MLLVMVGMRQAVRDTLLLQGAVFPKAALLRAEHRCLPSARLSPCSVGQRRLGLIE